jgi:hypothetical protein
MTTKKDNCRNLSFGLVTKAMACEGVGQEWSSRVTFHALRTVGEWGTKPPHPHTPKWTPILGIGVSMDFQTFRARL